MVWPTFGSRTAKEQNRIEARQNCAMVSIRRCFGDFLRPAFPASRVQYISDLHSKFALRPHHVWKYGRVAIIRAHERNRQTDWITMAIPRYALITAFIMAHILVELTYQCQGSCKITNRQSGLKHIYISYRLLVILSTSAIKQTSG